MKTRGFAVMVAIVLAALATGAVYLYVHGVKQQNHAAATDVNVLVSRGDIPAGTTLDPVIAQGQFVLKAFPASDVIQGAITNLDDLRGKTTSSGILAGEQITAARLQGSEAHTGGVLGISDGYEAITISLDAAHAGGGYVQAGDHVTIYAQGDINFVEGEFGNLLANPATATKRDIGVWSLTVVPDARVLRVFNGSTSSSSGSGTQGTQQSLQITLELKPEDAQRVILAREQLSIWLALLPPGQVGEPQGAANERTAFQKTPQ